MKLKLFHVWWLGILLFTPSVLIHICWLVFFSIDGSLYVPSDWHGIAHIYLPFLAALLGLCIPIVCLRLLRRSPRRRWAPIFIVYVVVMLTWGIIDIRCEHWQIGGHRYPNGVLVDGHKYYWHHYHTWYFLPYRWIEKGIVEIQEPFQVEPTGEQGRIF